MRSRSVCWLALGALSVACAAGAFRGPQRTVVESVTPGEGTIIQGVVHDSRAREPARAAIVVLQCDCLAGDREVQTDDDGQFTFRDLPPGRYEVLALYGTGESSKSLDVRADHTVQLRIVLSNDPHFVT